MTTPDQRSSHDHVLQLKPLEDCYTCNSCKEMSFGRRYSCAVDDCDFCIHEVCKNPPQKIEHPFFGENIVFDFKDSIRNCYCDACGRDIKGCSYHSSCTGRSCSFYGGFWASTKCRGHDLHPYCALTLLPNFQISSDDVKLFVKKKLSSKCGLCRNEKLRIKSWGYVSEDEEYQYHIYCMKNKLIRNWERMTLRDESALIRSNIIQGQMEERNGSNRNRRRSSTNSSVTRKIKFVLSLIVSVLLGNPTPVIIDIASSLLYN